VDGVGVVGFQVSLSDPEEELQVVRHEQQAFTVVFTKAADVLVERAAKRHPAAARRASYPVPHLVPCLQADDGQFLDAKVVDDFRGGDSDAGTRVQQPDQLLQPVRRQEFNVIVELRVEA
jgi:hypothetical protein